MHDFSIRGLLGSGTTFRQRVFRSMVRRARGVVTLSNDEKEFLELEFPHLRGCVECIPFGIDFNFFKRQEGLEKRQILSVGRDPDRDWETFIDATKNLDVPVVITSWISRLKPFMPLPQTFSVLELPATELVRTYAESAIVVISLDTSGRNNDAMGCSALFEAMSMGKAIVATHTKAMETYITHGENGLLVKEGDANEMRAAISKLLSDPVLRKKLGDAAFAYAQEHLEARKCTARLATLFKKIHT